MSDPDGDFDEWLDAAEEGITTGTIANAAQFLLEGQESEAADLLLSCDAHGLIDGRSVRINLFTTRHAYDILSNPEHPVTVAISRAFRADLGDEYAGFAVFCRIKTQMSLAELRSIAGGRLVHNQAPSIPGRDIVIWEGLRFRSKTEERIARSLDAAHVLFLPNCRARLSLGPNKRDTREADFLVCHEGKWGILEVDGPHHTRAAFDHGRDRAFRGHRIKVIERFDWEECYRDAAGVVLRFLTLLEKNG